jgi:REP element-mobilizing transposase RayT
MARPLRIEFPDAIYHATSRGDRQERIFVDDDDRRRFLQVLDQATQRFDAEVIAFCLMGNHYHLVLRTRQANLSRLMRHINGEYTQAFNRRHEVRGHLFQGRFHAILVDSDSYLMELCRYVELNPVRAGLVGHVEDWAWSSYRAHVGRQSGPKWLATKLLHSHLLGREPLTVKDQLDAARAYEELAADGHVGDFWGAHLRQGIYLGDERFVADMQLRADRQRSQCGEIPKSQRERSPALSDWQGAGHGRDEAIRMAYLEGGMTMSAIARQAGVSIATVSRVIARAENAAEMGPAMQDLAPCKT